MMTTRNKRVAKAVYTSASNLDGGLLISIDLSGCLAIALGQGARNIFDQTSTFLRIVFLLLSFLLSI